MIARARLAKMLCAAMNEALERRAGLPPITIHRALKRHKGRARRGGRQGTAPRPRQMSLPL